jgi:hypothetical protein
MEQSSTEIAELAKRGEVEGANHFEEIQMDGGQWFW